jgi:hypothetical protein
MRKSARVKKLGNDSDLSIALLNPSVHIIILYSQFHGNDTWSTRVQTRRKFALHSLVTHLEGMSFNILTNQH